MMLSPVLYEFRNSGDFSFSFLYFILLFSYVLIERFVCLSQVNSGKFCFYSPFSLHIFIKTFISRLR